MKTGIYRGIVSPCICHGMVYQGIDQGMYPVIKYPTKLGTGTGIRYPSMSIGAINILFNVINSICLTQILIVNRPCSVTNS